MAEELNFEKTVERLDYINARLEVGNLPLEEALALYEEGVTLCKKASKILEDARQRITELSEEGNG